MIQAVRETTKILVMGPESELLNKMAGILSNEENPAFEVICTRDFESGLEQISRNKVEAVLLSLNLPDARDFEMLRDLKRRFPTLTVIIISNHEDDALAYQAVKMGAEDCLAREKIHSRMLSRVLRYAIERKRKRSEFNLHAMGLSLENALDGISRMDAQGRFLVVNAPYAQILGYSAEELSGRDWETVIHPDDREKVSSSYRQMLFNTKSEVEARSIKKDGSAFHTQLALLKAFDENHIFSGHYCFLKDVTAKKNQDDKEALDLKSQFIAMVSHELRTPLHSIKEGIGLVLDGSAGIVNSMQKEFLDIAKRNAELLSRLINQVLDFQRLEAGNMPYDKKTFPLNDLVLIATQLLEEPARKKGVRLRLELSSMLPDLNVDKNKIIQAVLNLISNALQFTERGKTVTIHTCMDRNAVRLDVRDEGVGIKKELFPKLFKPFSQITENSKGPTGAGLGLAIVKKIIDQHGGKVDVDSEPKRGSTFSILLPL